MAKNVRRGDLVIRGFGACGLAAVVSQVLLLAPCHAEPTFSSEANSTGLVRSFLQVWGPRLARYCDQVSSVGKWLVKNSVKEKHVEVVEAGGAVVGWVTCKIIVPRYGHQTPSANPGLAGVQPEFHYQADTLQHWIDERKAEQLSIQQMPIHVVPQTVQTPEMHYDFEHMSTVPLGRIEQTTTPTRIRPFGELLRGTSQGALGSQ